MANLDPMPPPKGVSNCSPGRGGLAPSQNKMALATELMVLPLPGLNVPEPERTDWKDYMKMVLPHVGLALMCALYIVAGACIFYLVERPFEQQQREKNLEAIRWARENFLEELWELSARTEQPVTQMEWNEVADEHLDNISLALYNWYKDTSEQQPPTAGSNSTRMNWSFPAAVFFAASTVATIGYGNLTPVTQNGRIFCVFFGLFGVPLMLVTIADLGKFIGDGIMHTYEQYRRVKQRVKHHFWPSTPEEVSKEPSNTDEYYADFGVPSELLNDSVPVIWVLVIIVGYTAFGGWLMPSLETNWSFWDAFYFSFITMSTIGFGDFVPSRQQYYWVTLPYILLGLAIATMCVDLVGSQYIVKIHTIGRKFHDLQSRMRTIGDMMQYQRFLRRQYGLTDEELAQLPLDNFVWPLNKGAYQPRDLQRIYYIDQRTDTSVMSNLSLGERSSVACIREGETYQDNTRYIPIDKV